VTFFTFLQLLHFFTFFTFLNFFTFFYFFTFLFYIFSTFLQPILGCLTEGGPSGPNKPCIFPFIFEGKTYQGCPRDLKEPTKTW